MTSENMDDAQFITYYLIFQLFMKNFRTVERKTYPIPESVKIPSPIIPASGS